MFEEEKLITLDILEESVANDFGCDKVDVTIINFVCSAGSKKGDNFTCVVIAVKVKAKIREKLHEELNYMVKVMPVNEYRASWLLEVSLSLSGFLLSEHLGTHQSPICNDFFSLLIIPKQSSYICNRWRC